MHLFMEKEPVNPYESPSENEPAVPRKARLKIDVTRYWVASRSAALMVGGGGGALWCLQNGSTDNVLTGAISGSAAAITMLVFAEGAIKPE